MIDKLQPYLYLWQLPLIVLFLLVWTFGGAYLLRRVARKLLPDKRKQITLGRCILVMLLAGAVAPVSGVVLAMLVSAIGRGIGVPLTYLNAGLVAPVMFIMSGLCIYAIFELTVRQTFRAAVASVGPLFLFGALLIPAGAVPAWYIRHRDLRQNISLSRLMRIRDAIIVYERQELVPPDTLRTLVRTGYIEARHLTAPVAPARQVAFFYVPGKWPFASADADALRICTFVSSVESGRAAITADGRCIWATADEFASLADLPVNEAFAKALRAAEGP